MYLGVEIGGTKLQLGLGPGDGTLAGLWRGPVDAAAGAGGIRKQILDALPGLLGPAGLDRVRGIGIGFGGPVDDATGRTVKSHQVAGWDDFPLAEWAGRELGAPTALGNDADVAGLGEALFGAGRGFDPVFYITVGSGIGGGLIAGGRVYRGCGRGAAEIGHLRLGDGRVLEDVASGWALDRRLGRPLRAAAGDIRAGDAAARAVLDDALSHLADAVCQVIALVCPRRVVIGGGVSLLGEDLFFGPLRRLVGERVFEPFAGLTEVVPAALGEEVVVHGALALARQHAEGHG